ncbi:tetratricopeptide repeat protein [Hippea jasoniae]|uniref:tetratricopeptide repeat protein n=1 Tax=Hippea jasoniae TaxID=944479 RepID=UPI0005593DF6|nr:tetratricopeptide repeat protein [Hippea jasoniae]
MSKLYEALKKIENKNNAEKSSDIPFAPPAKPHSPLRFYLFLVLVFVVSVIGSFFVCYKFFYQNQRIVLTHTAKHFAVYHTTKPKPALHKTEIKKLVKQKPQPIQKVNKNAKPKEKQLKVAEKKVKIAIVDNATMHSEKEVIKEKNSQVVKENKENKVVYKSMIKTKKEIKHKRREKAVNIAELFEKIKSDDIYTQIDGYKKLLTVFPQNDAFYNNLAADYIVLGRYKDAVNVLKKALSFSDNPNLKLNLVVCYVKMGRIDLARSVFDSIDENSVKDKQLYFQLKVLLVK